MKLKVHLSDSEYDVATTFSDEGMRVSAGVDGRSYEVEFREVGEGQYLLIVGGRVSKVRVENRQAPSTGLFDVALRGHSYEIAVIDPKRLRTGESVSAHGAGTAQIVSPMPGKVVRVLVEAGAEVEAGEGIVVVEAMKMQNELKSPKAGTVVSIDAEVGATVSAGDVLARIE